MRWKKWSRSHLLGSSHLFKVFLIFLGRGNPLFSKSAAYVVCLCPAQLDLSPLQRNLPTLCYVWGEVFVSVCSCSKPGSKAVCLTWACELENTLLSSIAVQSAWAESKYNKQACTQMLSNFFYLQDWPVLAWWRIWLVNSIFQVLGNKIPWKTAK